MKKFSIILILSTALALFVTSHTNSQSAFKDTLLSEVEAIAACEANTDCEDGTTVSCSAPGNTATCTSRKNETGKWTAECYWDDNGTLKEATTECK